MLKSACELIVLQRNKMTRYEPRYLSCSTNLSRIGVDEVYMPTIASPVPRFAEQVGECVWEGKRTFAEPVMIRIDHEARSLSRHQKE
jgi:hypothetical protein